MKAAARRSISICGEMAGHQLSILLIAMGFDALHESTQRE